MLCRNELACKNFFLLRDDLFIIRSLKSCLRNQLTSTERDGANALLALNKSQFDLVQRVMADGGYTGNNFAQSVQAMINAEVIIAKQSDLRHGQVTPQRWVIERSFSWLGKYRRLWRNCERKLNTSKMMISLAFLRILLKRF
ncbi:hypothetical protein FGO89_12055 [Lacticaseibacillus paracasei]|nr:hypothetical protein FGO89_12055 [Lacticaseibacillus paracasei]